MRRPLQTVISEGMSMEDILFGVGASGAQSVGNMEVIPLIQQDERSRVIPEDAYGAPSNIRVGTRSYGTVDFENDSERTVIVPPGSGWVVKQAAQDHAIGSGKILGPKESLSVKSARCIQSSQAGLISMDNHGMLILPAELRGAALALGDRVGYDALWDSISKMTASHGILESSNLVDFLVSFKSQMDSFVAEFELIDDQIGAIVLINGNVVGVEVAPSREYWRSVWTPLIRVCYGSLAEECYRTAQKADRLVPMSNRMPLEMEGDTLEDLGDAFLRSQDEYAEASMMVFEDMKRNRALVGVQNESRGKNRLFTVGMKGSKEKNRSRLGGQMVIRDDNTVPFFSACIS